MIIEIRNGAGTFTQEKPYIHAYVHNNIVVFKSIIKHFGLYLIGPIPNVFDHLIILKN